MLFAMTEREAYDRFGDIPVLILFLVIVWGMRFVINNPDEVKDAAARAIRAICRVFK
jgi:hypothetical protein